jgi:hypothetical protein
MAKISTSSSVVSWRKMTKTTHPRKKTSSFPRKKKPIPHQPRRTRWQEASSLADHRRMTMMMTTMKKPNNNSGGDDGGDVDGSGGDSDVSTAPPIKRSRTSNAYWW